MRDMAGRLGRFCKLSRLEKSLFVEAWILQLVTGIVLKVIPFKRIPGLFANPHDKECANMRCENNELASYYPQERILPFLKEATRRAATVSPWPNKCLVSSLSARLMLIKRNIQSQLSLGVAKDSQGNLIAHAWLKVGEKEIVSKGGNYHQLYLF